MRFPLPALTGSAVVGSLVALGVTGAAAAEAYEEAPMITMTRVVVGGEVTSLEQYAGSTDALEIDEDVRYARDVRIVPGERSIDPALRLLDRPVLSSESEQEPGPETEPASTSEPEPESRADASNESAPVSDGAVPVSTWDRVAECESNGDWSINTGNGYYGGLQFALSSWEWVGGTGMPHEASKAEQITRAEILLERQGWVAWPACSRAIGLR